MFCVLNTKRLVENKSVHKKRSPTHSSEKRQKFFDEMMKSEELTRRGLVIKWRGRKTITEEMMLGKGKAEERGGDRLRTAHFSSVVKMK